MLIGARFLQGVGGAMTSAVILGMIVTMFPEPREQAKAIGVYSFVASAGASIGLLAGRRADRGDQLALDLLREPADRRRDRGARAAPGRGRRGHRARPGRRRARRRAGHRRADARRLHDPRGRRLRLGVGAHARPRRGVARAAGRRSSRARRARPTRSCRCGSSARATSRAPTSCRC